MPPYDTKPTGFAAHSVRCQSMTFFRAAGKLWLYSGVTTT